MSGCVFCEIVRGERPCHRIWEGRDHLAFLTTKPSVTGMAVVIPKRHYPSDALLLPDEALSALVVASKDVASLLRHAFEDVGRVGLVFEGFGVDHAHAKLYPLHGTRSDDWKPIPSGGRELCDVYEGEIRSGDGPPADPAGLAALAERIRGSFDRF